MSLHSIYVISALEEKQKQTVYHTPNCVNSQNQATYTLLIITYKPIAKDLGDLMDEIYHKMQQRCRVYLINYTLSKTVKLLDLGDNFLTPIIPQVPCLYLKDDALSRFKNYGRYYHPTIYEEIRETWTVRMRRARYLLYVLDSVEPMEDVTARMAIMQSAMEQVCLGLLYVFWEFRPQYYALSYLFHLCGHFTQLPQTIFPKRTYGLQRKSYMLCNAHDIMRFKSKTEFSDNEADKVYNKCIQFFDEAKRLGDRHLESLEKLHCKNTLAS
ncbi:hypothetical protein [Aestuariivivens insulae]|uniref:hypothetical protein n=1 Tax=Aestuariivivens insulae TaxID=1621988 RepID=UPI001F588DFB|nr:hypothetical protein [Aestuariivivens insulae]